MDSDRDAARSRKLWSYLLVAILVAFILLAGYLLGSSISRGTKGAQFVPGVGAIDPKTGRPVAPTGAARGGRGRGGAELAAAEGPAGGREAGFAAGRRSDEVPTPKPMLIRTGTIGLRVDDVETAHEQVARIAREANGYVADTSFMAEHGPARATLTIRVPTEGLDSIVARISDLGKVLSKQLSTQEVTEEYVDLSSRKRNLEREEERLLDLLSRAALMKDLLEVEQQLARVRGQIEQIAGRMRYLENRVDLASLTVQLEGPEPQLQVTGPVWTAVDEYRQAMRSLRETGRGLATMGIWLAVYAPIWVPIVLVAGWVTRRLYGQEKSEEASGE